MACPSRLIEFCIFMGGGLLMADAAHTGMFCVRASASGPASQSGSRPVPSAAPVRAPQHRGAAMVTPDGPVSPPRRRPGALTESQLTALRQVRGGYGHGHLGEASGPVACEGNCMRKYIIMGVQGSGKGTQAKTLAGAFDLVHIAVSVADWLTGYGETAIPGVSASSTPAGDEEPLNLDWLEEERQTLNGSVGQDLPGTELPEGVVSPFENDTDDHMFFGGELPDGRQKTRKKPMLAEAVVVQGEKGGDLVQRISPSGQN